MEENNIVEWTPNKMLEVTLNEPDDFLKIIEKRGGKIMIGFFIILFIIKLYF